MIILKLCMIWVMSWVLQVGPEGNVGDTKDDSNVVEDNAVCVTCNIGDNTVSVAGSGGEIAALVFSIEVDNSISSTVNNGENIVSVDGDHSDAIDKEVCYVHQNSCKLMS